MDNQIANRKQWNQTVAEQWGLFLPPARPSISELAIFEKYLLNAKKKNPKIKVAILGSTPEYRDLCNMYDADYCCIDYRAQNFNELRSFMLHKDDDSHLIESDWCTMDFTDKFDLVFGDLVTTVIPVKDHETIFKSIQKHCNKGATLILKTPLRLSNKQLMHAQIFSHYRKKLYYLNPFAAVWYEVLLADYDFNDDTMHCQTSLNALTNSLKKGDISKFEYEEFKKRWDALGDFKMNIPLRREYLKKASHYFKIERITSGTDWYKNDVPVLIFLSR